MSGCRLIVARLSFSLCITASIAFSPSVREGSVEPPLSLKGSSANTFIGLAGLCGGLTKSDGCATVAIDEEDDDDVNELPVPKRDDDDDEALVREEG